MLRWQRRKLKLNEGPIDEEDEVGNLVVFVPAVSTVAHSAAITIKPDMACGVGHGGFGMVWLWF